MVAQIHYETEEGPQVYNITVTTREEMERALNHFKDEIYDYLVSNNLKWIEDPTNTNTDFTRNFWRNVGLPTIEKHYPNIIYNDIAY